MASQPPLINVHTPYSSFSIIHSLTQDTLQTLCDKLTRKVHSEYHGARVGPGWLKYEHNDSIWNLDDESDYTIFTWRQQQTLALDVLSLSSIDHSSASASGRNSNSTPTLHLHDPSTALPSPPAYTNPSYYLFRSLSSSHLHKKHTSSSRGSSPKPKSTKSRKSKHTIKGTAGDPTDDGVPVHKKQFEKFHNENGVRTVIGSIGPVQNVRMLLKSGYRHVYISRKFAMKHGFIPADAAPGHYGYGGLVNIGTWPITLTPVHDSGHNNQQQQNESSQQPIQNGSSSTAAVVNGNGSTTSKKKNKDKDRDAKDDKDTKGGAKPKPTMIAVYLSEEPHFDIVLGRSFFEKRQIRTNVTDMTDVVCLDTGEKIECELVILKDGRGEIVTVT